MGHLLLTLLLGVWTPASSRAAVVLQTPYQTILEIRTPGVYLVAIPEGSTWHLTTRPRVPVKVLTEGFLRELRVVSLQVDQAPTRLTLTYGPGGTYPHTVSPAFVPLYRRIVANARALDLKPGVPPRSGTGARYLIIVPDDWLPLVQPLAEWKTHKGMLARVVPLSVAGSSPQEIHNYIQTVYNNWDIKPEYLLLVGNAQHIPFQETDNNYVRVVGSDIFIDILPGRFPAASATEVQTMVAKTLNYEQAQASDTLWYHKATTLIRDDNDAGDSIYYADVAFATMRMRRHGYFHIDFFSADSGNNANDVILAVNDGRSLVFYRGQGVGNWWPPFDVNPYLTQNGDKLPIIVSTTCATIDPYGGESAGEQWMAAGSPTEFKGAVGFFGTTTVRSHVAHLRSAVAQGFFAGVFDSLMETFGQVCENGRLNLYFMYADLTDYDGFTTLGDPELTLRTRPPVPFTAQYPATLSPEDSQIEFEIRKGLDAPVAGALVCVYQDTSVYAYGYTDAQGRVVLPLAGLHGGVLRFTVTKRDFRPLQDSIPVIVEGPYPIPLALTVADEGSPSADGQPNPGEVLYLGILLKNAGTAAFHNLVLKLSSLTPGVELVDSVAEVATLAPGDTVSLPQAWQIQVGSNFHDGDTLQLALTVEASEGTWHRGLPSLIVAAPHYRILELVVDDSPPLGNVNGVAEPGENLALYPRVTNGGHQATQATHLYGLSNIYVVFSDPRAVGSGLAPGDTTLLSNPLHLHIAPGTPANIVVSLNFLLEAPAGTFTLQDTLNATLTIGGSSADTGPVGPDEYGYYIYDDTDTLTTQAPLFQWTEIAPPGPGQEVPRVAHADADTATLPLPFAFVFYGDTFTRIGISSNGFLELGGSTYRFGANTPIPDASGPRNLIAPFWDDLDPSQGGSVYFWSDEANHRWIVEFDAVPHFGNGDPETFQVILYDPAYRPTPTGDGVVEILYHTVSDPSSCTVGTESPGAVTGLQYVYNSNYAEHAAPLESFRALRITTVPPYMPVQVWVHTTGYLAVSDAPSSQANGWIEPGDSLQVTLEVTNSGTAPATNLVLTLSSLHPQVVLLDSVVTLASLAPGDTARNLQYLLWIEPSFPDSTALLQLTLQSDARTDREYLELPLYGLSVEEGSPRPRILRLGPVYPNPTRSRLVFQVALPTAATVHLALYDLQGRRLWHDSLRLAAGLHGIPVTLRTYPAGPYFLRARVGPHTRTWKVLHLR